jgi:hypothetical protein
MVAYMHIQSQPCFALKAAEASKEARLVWFVG